MSKRAKISHTQINYIQEICALIDRSGSMLGKEMDTIGGINETFRVLRETKQPNEIIKISIKLFDHEQILKLRNVELDNVNDLTRDDFSPRGQTALLDAIGDTLTYFMEKKLMDPGAYDSCVIYITTDGLEFGIDESRAMNYSETPENITSAYRSAASVAFRTRSLGKTEFTQEERIASCE